MYNAEIVYLDGTRDRQATTEEVKNVKYLPLALPDSKYIIVTGSNKIVYVALGSYQAITFYKISDEN